MRKLKLGKVPDVLKGSASLGGKEKARAIAFYEDRPENAAKKFTPPFGAYSQQSVKDAINALSAFKCAYCESRYGATQPVDVEHYRPKGGVFVNGRLRKPGYYWLAAEWKNLLPSCIDCNRERGHVFSDSGRRTSGKANTFPIANEARRAQKQGQESKERPLLLNPRRDNPEAHLTFDEEGIVLPALDRRESPSRKGETSIYVFGLLRPGLVQERAALAREVDATMARIETLTLALQQTGNALIEGQIRTEIAGLKGRAEPDQPYSEMVRQLTADFLDRVA